MAQLCLFSESLLVKKPAQPLPAMTHACDIFVQSWWDDQKRCIRIKPLSQQAVSDTLWVRCSHKARKLYPIGTIFKLDLRLTAGKKANNQAGKPYLMARGGQPMQRAIEYFEHNIHLQKAAQG